MVKGEPAGDEEAERPENGGVEAEGAEDADVETESPADAGEEVEGPEDGGVEGGGEEPLAVTIDEEAIYLAVRRAVEDAVLGVIGTLLLVGVALVLVWVGGAMALNAGTGQPVATVAGLVIALFGVYVAGSALEVIPPVGEWF